MYLLRPRKRLRNYGLFNFDYQGCVANGHSAGCVAASCIMNRAKALGELVPEAGCVRSSKGLSVERHMAKHSTEDARLTRLTGMALALPEVIRQIKGSHAQFLVRKKTFAYFLDNHHGDGIVAVACKALPGDNKALAEAQPARFYLPAYIASRGWVALRLDVGKVDWGEVRDLLSGSYAMIAPKRLAERVTVQE